MEGKVYSIKEAAEILGMSRSGVHWLKDTGKIKAQKIGEQYVITREELDRYKDNQDKPKKEGEMRTSQIYKCPKCGDPVKFEATFESDEYGDRVELEVTCQKCHDTRYDSIDEMKFDFAGLVAKIGT